MCTCFHQEFCCDGQATELEAAHQMAVHQHVPYLGALGDSTTLGQIKGGSYEGGNLMYAYIIYMSSSYYTASCMLDLTHAIVLKPLPVLSCHGRVRMPVLCAIGLCPFE